MYLSTAYTPAWRKHGGFISPSREGLPHGGLLMIVDKSANKRVLRARNRERKSSLIPLRYTLRHLLCDYLETRMDKGLELSTPLR